MKTSPTFELPDIRPKHLVIIGGGSAAFAAAIRASELGARVTMINEGLPIGGTCVNAGCIPSKTLIRAAETLYRGSHPNFLGIDSRTLLSSFPAVVSQKRQLVEQLRQAKYRDVISDLPNFRLIEGRGRLLAPGAVEANGERLLSDRILIATGASPLIPPIPGLAKSEFLTNETAFELEELPASLIVLGGRYIALECAQMFARLGSRVTILQRSPRILPAEAADLTDALTAFLKAEGIEVVTGAVAQEVHREGNQIFVEATVDGARRAFRASHKDVRRLSCCAG